MTVAAFPQIITNIVTTLRSSGTLTNVRIYDGPEIDEGWTGNAIAIGHDGSEDGDLQAATMRNSYDQLGAKKMFEDGQINCTMWAWNGDTNLAALRPLAFDLLSKVDSIIRIDPSFQGSCLYSGLENHTASYRQTNAGAVVIINFTIVYRART